MAHPVLRRVSQLDIVAVMDLEMAREYCLKVANLQNGQLRTSAAMITSISLMIDISRENWDPIYDAALIINVLTNFSHIHFAVWHPAAAGARCLWSRAILLLPACWSASRCAAVTHRRTRRTVSLYDNFSKLCVRADQLFRDTSMRQLISQYDYMHTLLAQSAVDVRPPE
ncbi:MAG: hypothetical protein ACLUJU_05365 [Subdoligranulum sp.]